jgi:natural product biosynthesis luciferase-like monooxygenase protein
VLPLHHPIRVAEEWSVADNLSQGRTAISIATGWHPNDFVFAPEAYKDRRNICLQNLNTIQRLWRGESVELPTPGGENLSVKLHPMPRQRELPIWLTCIHKESYAEAGRSGFNVLGYLMNQTVDELAEKIAAYREGRRSAGLEPAAGHVTTLLFTYLDSSVEKARETARGPLCNYLRSYLDNSQKKIEQQVRDMKVDEEDIEYLTNRSCDDYFNGKSLIGTADSCAAVVERLKKIGVDEIGCFVDFGIEPPRVLQSLREVGRLLDRAKEKAAPSDEKLPLPQAEQGLWLLGTLNRDAALAYRESVTLRLAGDLDRASLERALQEVVNRHGALRVMIDPEGRSQTVPARRTFDLEWTDLTALPPEKAAAAASQKLAESEVQPIPSLSGPFLSGHLLKVEAKSHLLVLFFHHVVGNGPSYWVVLEELADLYRGLVGGQSAPLPPVFPFAEFVEKKRAYEKSTESEEAEKFWLKQMAGAPNLDLPFDHALPPQLTYLGARQEIVLPRDLTAGLKKIGAAHRSSLFMVMLSAYGVLMHRLTGQDDVVVAAPFDSPIRAESTGRNLFANTTNMLPLRSSLAEGSSFLDYLAQMKGLVLAASEHQDYFFGNLVSKLGLARDSSRAPLFNVVFNLETGEFKKEFPGLRMELETRDVPYRSPRGTAMFDLYLNAAELENGETLVQCDHNTALIEPETMQRWLSHFETLLRAIAADPARPARELPLVAEPESAKLSEPSQEATASAPMEPSAL